MIRWSFPTHHVARSLSMPKLTLHDMPRVAQAQMRAALRRARYGSLRAGMACRPSEPHRLGGRSWWTNAPRRSDRAGLTAKPCGMPMLCSWQKVSTEEDFFLPITKNLLHRRIRWNTSSRKSTVARLLSRISPCPARCPVREGRDPATLLLTGHPIGSAPGLQCDGQRELSSRHIEPCLDGL
jgi:hypothetical protein